MVSTYTTNKVLELPGNGDYVDTWNVPANGDFSVIDQAFGGTTSLNATSGSATLTSTQYRSLFLNISGAISAAVTYTIPAGVGGQWIVYNSTTDSSGGPWAVTVQSGGGGAAIAIPRLTRIIIVCDGTSVRLLSYVYDNGTVNGNLTVTGDISTGGAITAGTTIAAAASLTAGTTISDQIGDVRNVPANGQSSNYTLQASDSGKFINITSGNITVPNGVFSAGQTISVFNNSSSSMSIIQGAGATIRRAGTTDTGTRSLAAYGLATILCFGSNTFVITGAGIT